jgi:hypothetical protein
MPNAKDLLSYANQHELLPNLHTLTLNTQYISNLAYTSWFHVFACRSLTEMRPVAGEYDLPFMRIPLAATLAKAIVQRCTRLETLSIFPSDNTMKVFDHDLERLFPAGPGDTLESALVNAKSLTSITGSGSLLEADALLGISTLPLLARFEAWFSRDRHDDELPQRPLERLPEGSFPALRNFVAHNIVRNDVDYLWNFPPLVSQLATVDISFYVPPEAINTPWPLLNFIPLLCQNSLRITDLGLSFYSSAWQELNEPYVCKFTEPAFEAIAVLRLTRLNVVRARLVIEGATERLATT